MAENKKTIYQSIQHDILNKIEQGIYEPGTLLPSENQMAEIYGTSVPTVRRALGDLVYQKVIFRIKGKGTFVSDAMEEGEEQEKNLTRRNNKEKRDTKLCFLVLSDTSDSSIMEMIRGAQSYLFSKGYNMSILYGEEGVGDEMDLVQECLDRNMEGVIWFSMVPEGNLEGLKMMKTHEIPVVMLDRGPAQIPFTLVSAYNLDGGYQMGKYLTDLGHRRILFAASEIGFAAERDRIAGYRLALEEKGISYEEQLVIKESLRNLDLIVERVKEFGVTAVQCVNDKVACQVIGKLEQEGYRVPEDISVTGFDNSAESEYSRPRITTIDQPFEDMGRMAAKKLLKLLNGKQLNSQTYLPVELVVKESSCAPAEQREEGGKKRNVS